MRKLFPGHARQCVRECIRCRLGDDAAPFFDDFRDAADVCSEDGRSAGQRLHGDVGVVLRERGQDEKVGRGIEPHQGVFVADGRDGADSFGMGQFSREGFVPTDNQTAVVRQVGAVPGVAEQLPPLVGVVRGEAERPTTAVVQPEFSARPRAVFGGTEGAVQDVWNARDGVADADGRLRGQIGEPLARRDEGEVGVFEQPPFRRELRPGLPLRRGRQVGTIFALLSESVAAPGVMATAGEGPHVVHRPAELLPGAE